MKPRMRLIQQASLLAIGCSLIACGPPAEPQEPQPSAPAAEQPSENIDSPPTEPGAAPAQPSTKENDASGSTSPMPDH